MDNKDIFVYGQYLSRLVASILNSTVPDSPFEDMDWTRLYKLADFHNLTALVYPALKDLSVPADILQNWRYANNRLIARETRQAIEADMIFGILRKENIPFIRMKGIVTKNFYPAPYMRTQADVDICMSEEHRRYCSSIMKELGYEIFSVAENTDEYVKDNFYYYELHSSVYPTTSDFYNIFEDPFSKASESDDGTGYVFTDEYFYLHLITHLYKHFVTEGCGIRLLCDLYVYNKAHQSLDYNFINSVLKEHKLDKFHESILNLNEALFGNKEYTQDQIDIATFIFSCGDHGSDTIRRLTNSNPDKIESYSKKNRIKFALEIYFPKADTLKNRYHVLEKAPVLLPFFWVVRGFSTLFFKRDALKEQNEIIRSVNSQETQEAVRVQTLMGIRIQTEN